MDTLCIPVIRTDREGEQTGDAANALVYRVEILAKLSMFGDIDESYQIK